MRLNIKVITLPTPFMVGPVNVYLLEGEPLTLVDTGPKTPAALDALEAGLAQHGYRIADIAQVVISHAHHDHVGLAGTLRAAGASIATSAVDAPLMDDFSEAWVEHAGRMRPLLAMLGLPPGKQAALYDNMVWARNLSDPVHSDRPLYGGEALRAGGADWLVLETPGHAVGHICLYQSAEKVLLSGDHLLGNISSNPIMEPPDENGERPRSLVRFIESLRRTAALEVRRTLPAHGDEIADHRALIDRRIAFHEQRKKHIGTLLADGPVTAYELSEQIFPRLEGEDIFLGVSEVVGHLDLLELEGAAKAELSDGLLYYSAS